MLSVKVFKSQFCLSEVFSTQLVEDTSPSERHSNDVSHDPTWGEQHSGQRPKSGVQHWKLSFWLLLVLHALHSVIQFPGWRTEGWLQPVFMCAKSLQLCLTICDPMNCSPPGSAVHGILQTRILEWVAMPSSKGSPQSRLEPGSLMSPALADGFFTTSATWEACTTHI